MSQCVFCGQQLELVHLHGHYQCPVCKTNAMPCCDRDNVTNVLLKHHKIQTSNHDNLKLIYPTAVPVATTINMLPLEPTVSKSRSIPTTAFAP